MIVHTAYFGAEMTKMAGILRGCLEKHCPTAQFRPVVIRYPLPIAGAPTHVGWNLAKLEQWNDYVQVAEEPIVCMDTDMIVIGDLGRAFDPFDSADGLAQGPEWDFGYTVRPGPHRINAGVVFVRPTHAGKAFFQRWTDRNAEISAESGAITELIKTYGGANQASLALTVKGARDAVLQEFDCAVWNSVRQTWAESIMGLQEAPRPMRAYPGEEYARPVVIHINSHLRRACFTGRLQEPGAEAAWLNPLIQLWLDCSRG